VKEEKVESKWYKNRVFVWNFLKSSQGQQDDGANQTGGSEAGGRVSNLVLGGIGARLELVSSSISSALHAV
jgi:hypothetical protein